MNDQKTKEQVQKLKELAEKAPENLRKVVKEKIKGFQKPINK